VRFFKQADWKQQINWLIFLCLGICFFLSIINQTRVINFYYAAIILAIIAQLISLDHFSYTNLWVPGVMVCWAVIRWAWLLWQGYPHHAYSQDAYGAYWQCSKYLFWGAPLLLYALSSNTDVQCHRRRQLAALIFYGTDVVATVLAIKFSWIDGVARIQYFEQIATLSAYLMCITHFLALNHYLSRAPRWNRLYVSLVLFLVVLLQFYALVLTGTRSAMLVFVVMLPCLFLSYYRQHWRKIAGVFVVSSLAAWLCFGKYIEPRVAQIESDITQYHRTTEVTSVGARLSMWSAAWYVIKQRPFGEPIEQRHQMISDAVHADKLDPQVLTFMDVHLHNDWAEITTLMGVGGAGLLFAWYASLFYLACKRRGPAGRAIFIVATCSLGFGMTDTLYIWGWFITFIVVLLAIIALAYPDGRRQIRHKNSLIVPGCESN